MAFQFPNSPILGQTTINTLTDISYTWDGSAWVASNIVSSPNLEYISVRRGTSDVGGITNGSDLIFNTIDQGSGLIYNLYNTTTGVFRLSVGNTYKLDAGIYFSNFSIANGYMIFGWVDASTNSELIGSQRGCGLEWNNASAANSASQPRATILYKPSTNINVKLRVVASSGGTTATFRQAGSFANIYQIC